MSEKLYNFLSEQGNYTKSYEDFQTQFVNQDSIQNLYNFMSEKGDYTKSFEEFDNQFFKKTSVVDDDSSGSLENLSQEERQILSDKTFSIKSRRTASGDVIKGSMGAVYADNTVNIIKSLFTDKKEREEIFTGLGNIVDDKANNLYNTFTKTIPAEIARVYKDVAFDDLYNKEELEYLKTQNPDASYEDPSGDPTGFKTNADRIKYLEGYKNTSAAKQEEKINKFVTKKYKEVEIYNKYLRPDTGEGIVKGIKQGDASDVVLGVFNAGASMVETVVPAMLTSGVSLPFQITAPMLMDYNQQKAERIYGKDDPNAIAKLLQNKEDETAVPGALGLIASGFEYVGYKGITNYMLGKAAKGTVARLVLTGNKEGITELGQSGIEEVNNALAQGKEGLDVAKAFIDGVFSEKGLESYLQGFIGGTSMSAGGRAINRALRSDNASVKELNGLVNNLAELNVAKNSATNPTAKEAIEVGIKEAEQALKNYITDKRKIVDILNEDQKENLINAINEKDNINFKVESLKNQLNNNEISSKEFGYAVRSLNNQNKKLTEQIELINATAKEQLLQTSLETTKEESKKLGLEQIELSQEEFAKQFPDDADSDGAIVGGKIYINRDVARETGAIGVGSHELLHGIIGNSYQKLGKEEKVKLNTEFLNLLGAKEKQAILTRLAGSYGITGDKVFETEELFTAFSDEIVDGGLAFNEGVFGKVKNTVHKVLNKFGYRKEFESARQTYNFLKDYSKNIKQGKLTERAAEFAKEDPGVEGERFSKVYQEVEAMKPDLISTDPAAKKNAALIAANTLENEVDRRLPKLENVNKEAREDIVRDFLFSEGRGLTGLLTKYDPNINESIMGYLNSFVPGTKMSLLDARLQEFYKDDPRFGNIVQSMEQEGVAEKVEQQAAEETVAKSETETKKKKIVLADRLGVTEEVAKAIKKLMPEIDFNKETFKSLKNQIPKITGEIFGISPKKLVSGANITKGELQSAQMFINKNADVLISMLPEGATAGGTATGVPQTLLKAFYTKTDRAKMAKTGTKAGLAIQQKNDIKKADFLETFGIIDGKPDRTDRNTSARVLALANQTGKMMTNQAVREQLSENITEENAKSMLKLSDGKSAIMFSKSNAKENNIPNIVDYFGDKTEAEVANILDQHANLTDKQFKEQFPNEHGNVKNYIEDMTQFVADGGKEAMQFTKEMKGVNFGNNELNNYLKTGYWNLSDAKFKQDKKAIKWFENNAHDLASQILLPENATNGNMRIIMGFFAGHYNIVGSDMAKVGSTLKQGILDRLNKKGKSVLSKKTLDRWKNFDFENLKGSYASTFYTGLKKIYAANSLKEQKAIAKEYFTGKESATQKDFYDLWNTTLEEWLHSSEVGSKEFNSKADYILKLKKANAAIGTTGERIMAPGGYVYLPGSIMDGKVKFEHLKSSSQQSKESALLVINNKFKEFGDLATEEYIGIYGPLELFNAIDEATGRVNSSNIFRLAGNLEAAKSIYSIDNLNQSLYDEIVSTIGKDKIKLLEQTGNKKQVKKLDKAIMFSRSTNESKGISVLDFDDTLATTESLVKFTRPDGTTGTLNAEQYASTYEDLLDQGFTFDFSDFNKVVKGKLAPLFQKALKLQGKFGPENMFVLTARPPQAAKAIFDFLKANGLNIPMKNITGLANSTAEAKALWIADKVGDGFNDFYFADDALQNVQAVKNMLDQFDVKSKVQQAKVKFSKSMNDQFNDILENVTGIEAKKRFSAIKGRKRGESKGKFRFFIPPSHEDFVGLLYNFLGKGKEGNAHRDFFEQALIRPLNRANREYDTARQSVANDYKALNKQFEDVRKKLTKKTPDGDFTFQDAIRVYLWNKHDHSVPGLSETDQTNLSELVMSDPQLQAYAETLNIISKQETYVNPTEGWNSGDIRMDLDDATGRIGRKEFFAEFIENADVIFSEENLNKIEAGYGKGVRESLEDMLYRIKTGRNRPTGQNAQVNKLMNYLNGSVGTVMFFNMRSALLQQMSIVNYINFADNNIFAAAKAFANQKQYWKDFAFIFNSDMLKQRRGGIQTDVNGAELAASLRNSKDITRKLISKLLELGFLPTQIGDNIAIATGGASYYRNVTNKYVKQGMSQKEAEAKAFTDFQAITQSTQQSARPDMVSKQQASVIGKVILNFQNVTSQFNRLGKKAFQDIYNRRITKPNETQMQSDISNAARITYYFAVQNAIFYTLQTALFAMMFDDDEEDDNKLFLKKKERLINGSIDSVLRGSGLVGGVVATLKNVAIAFARQRDVNYNPDESAVALEALNLSPVLGIKLRKIVNAEKTLNYNKKVIKEMETFDIDNPQWSAVTNYTEALTNVPLNRLYNKTQNVRQALNNEHAAWERTLMFLGWSQYNLNLENKKMDDIKESVKSKKKSKKSKGFKNFKFK